MSLSDQDRIRAQRIHSPELDLWRALTALRSVVSFMNTGAHPDDETSEMLAALRYRDGIDISYACSTRGEGGQNDIGTEAGAALGVLRTGEMEAACRELDMRMYWHCQGPDDPITDFGFSKSGKETLAKWGHARTLERFVEIIRTERPDIICPTFLDVPGQHGHHRAMTQAAHEVMDLAADPEFEGSTLPPWQVKKLCLPAWSGAGQAYDDDLPPPDMTFVVEGRGSDPVSGWSYAQIGQQSRVHHATQAMGRWVLQEDERNFPLHLADGRVEGAALSLTAGLPQTLRDIGAATAQDACDAAIAAFPDREAVLRHACAALEALPEGEGALAHKFRLKRAQLAKVIHLAAGVDVRAQVKARVIEIGESADMEINARSDQGELRVQPRLPAEWTAEGNRVSLSPSAEVSDPYPDTYFPNAPDAPYLDVAVTVNGINVPHPVAFDAPPSVIPSAFARLEYEKDILNLAGKRRSFDVAVSGLFPATATPDLLVPEGWSRQRNGMVFTVSAPQGVGIGQYVLPLTLDGQPAQDVQRITMPDQSVRALVRPAVFTVQVIDAALPQARVGYVGGGHDRVSHWLARMGADVTDLSESEALAAELEALDTLVIGIFALRFREGLAEALPAIHEWVAAGGTLITLYHRPWDNWDPASTAPLPLEIGQPSLRWRITDENAEVQVLAPQNPLLHHPNEIGLSDWQGWHKERGLYFAKSWDDAYVPLIALRDPEEEPLHGAWLAADVGAGRHIHTSLILHHQMEHLVPGAFRLMANMIAKRS